MFQELNTGGYYNSMVVLAFSQCARHLAVATKGGGKLCPPSAQPPRFFSLPSQRVAFGAPRSTASQKPTASASASAVPGAGNACIWVPFRNTGALQLPPQFSSMQRVADAGELKPGQLIGGKYEVLQVLGRGGNAVTYTVGIK